MTFFTERIDLVVPAVAAEHAVVADAGLHVVALEIGPQSGAQIVRGHGLADGADVVPLAFDREQHRAPDRARVDALALPLERAGRQAHVLKDLVHGLEVELGGEVEHGEVFVVERLRRLRLLDSPSPDRRTARDAPSHGGRGSCS